jgi:acyl-CoA thioesterase I
MRSLLLAALLGGLALPAQARAPVCNASLDLVRLANPLPRLAARLAASQPITIVAIGSSSTAGAGASSPAASYPSRLADELSQHFPRHQFTMINRGVSGEEVEQMLARFDSNVIAEKPDLVIWQLGTNSVIRDHPMRDHGALIREGLAKLKALGVDVILLDPQFAPKVIVKSDAESMVDLIAATAKAENVDLFRRFALMRKWRQVEGLPFEAFVSPDGLHLNDWSYACLAKSIGMAIAEAVTRSVASAAAQGLR